MRKALLIGDLNDTLQSIGNSVKDEFISQMCSGNSKNVQDMIRIYRPEILIFNIMDITEDVKEIFEKMIIKLSQMPMLIICTREFKGEINRITEGFKNVEVIFRPVDKNSILSGCYRALKIDMNKISDETVKPSSVEQVTRSKVMVVDDSALILRKIKGLLEGKYDVILAGSGEQALDFIPTKKPDLILLDYDMPGMDGKETFERILENDAFKDIPVIFLTSIAEKNLILNVIKHKPYGYILKPPDSEKIISVIEEALNN